MIYIVKANKGDTEIISKIECEEGDQRCLYRWIFVFTQ